MSIWLMATLKSINRLVKKRFDQSPAPITVEQPELSWCTTSLAGTRSIISLLGWRMPGNIRIPTWSSCSSATRGCHTVLYHCRLFQRATFSVIWKPGEMSKERRVKRSHGSTVSYSWRPLPRQRPTSRRPLSTQPERFTTKSKKEFLISTMRYWSSPLILLWLYPTLHYLLFQANGIKIGPQHSPANPNMPAGSQGGTSGGGCC